MEQTTVASLPTAAAAGTWKCDACLVRNELASLLCVACETPGPQAPPDFKKPSVVFGGPALPMASAAANSASFSFGIESAAAKPPLPREEPDLAASVFFPAAESKEEASPQKYSFGLAPTPTFITAGSREMTADSTTAVSATAVFGSSSDLKSAISTPVTSQHGGSPASAVITPPTFAPMPETQRECPAGGANAGAEAGLSEDNVSWKGDEDRRVAPGPLELEGAVRVPTGDVWTWGSGECDQMPFKEKDMDECLACVTPTRADKFTCKEIVAVTCGALHSLAILASGGVLSWGCNDSFALGRTEKKEKLPYPVLGLPPNDPVVEVSCGDNHSACRTLSGRCLLWGSFRDGAGPLGFPDFEKGSGSIPEEKTATPTLVPMTDLSCTKIACGESHAIALCRQGLPEVEVTVFENREAPGRRSVDTAGGEAVVVLWGSNEYGQLGVPPPVRHPPEGEEVGLAGAQSFMHPRTVTAETMGCSRIIDAFCSKAATFIHGERQGGGYGLWSCGRNSCGEAGIGTSDACVNSFIEVEALRGKRVSRLVGGQFNVCALVNGVVYSWGHWEFCGLGRKKTGGSMVRRPAIVEGLPTIERLECGGGTTYAVSSKGVVFAWGEGQLYQIGDGVEHVDPVLKPHAVDPDSFGGKFPLAVCGGSQHAVALMWDGGYARAHGEPEAEAEVERLKRRRESVEEFDQELRRAGKRQRNDVPPPRPKSSASPVFVDETEPERTGDDDECKDQIEGMKKKKKPAEGRSTSRKQAQPVAPPRRPRSRRAKAAVDVSEIEVSDDAVELPPPPPKKKAPRRTRENANASSAAKADCPPRAEPPHPPAEATTGRVTRSRAAAAAATDPPPAAVVAGKPADPPRRSGRGSKAPARPAKDGSEESGDVEMVDVDSSRPTKAKAKAKTSTRAASSARAAAGPEEEVKPRRGTRRQASAAPKPEAPRIPEAEKSPKEKVIPKRSTRSTKKVEAGPPPRTSGRRRGA